MTEPALRVAGYVRVSTEEQRKHGWNLGEDRRVIEEKVAAIDLSERKDGRPGASLVEVFDDGGRQGDDPDRPGFLALLAALPDLDVVVIRQQDRITRSPGIWDMAQAAFVKHKVRILTFTAEIDLDTPQGQFMADMMAAVGKLEKGQIGQRVRQALEARARAGYVPGGHARYGYRWHHEGDEKLIVPVDAEGAIVCRIYEDYANGMGQRQIARALENEGLTNRGGVWRQNAVSRILSDPIYMGTIVFNGKELPGKHTAIIKPALWKKVQANKGRRKGGRHADGGHLLVRGVLRCGQCGSAMIPRKERPGVERARYVCSGRIEYGKEFCEQPSVRREIVDEPFLANVLDHYMDLEAARHRIAQRIATDLALAVEAVEQARAEVDRTGSRLARIQRGWQEGVLDDEDYQEQRNAVRLEMEAAEAALGRAERHAEHVEEHGPTADAEAMLVEQLAAVKHAVAEGAGSAPDVLALRNAISDLFESVELIDLTTKPYGSGRTTEGFVPGDRPNAVAKEKDQPRYALLPRVRWSSVDLDTSSPIGQLTPVPPSPQYAAPLINPDSTLARYCWW